MEHTVDRIEKMNIKDIDNEYQFSIYIINYTIKDSTYSSGIAIVKANNEADATNIFKHDSQLGSLVNKIDSMNIKKLNITRLPSLLYECCG